MLLKVGNCIRNINRYLMKFQANPRIGITINWIKYKFEKNGTVKDA